MKALLPLLLAASAFGQCAGTCLLAAPLALWASCAPGTMLCRGNPMLIQQEAVLPYQPVPCRENGPSALYRSLPPEDDVFAPIWLPLSTGTRATFEAQRDYYAHGTAEEQCWSRGLEKLLEADRGSL